MHRYGYILRAGRISYIDSAIMHFNFPLEVI